MVKTGESPEYVLTGRIAPGFRAEGAGDKKKVIDRCRDSPTQTWTI